MIFIASKKSENKFTVHAEIPFKSDKVKYQSNFHVCPNPACGCDDLIVKLSLDDENIAGVASEKAEFIISISARKLNEERISPEHLSFARTIIRHFDEEDWKILEQAFFSERCKLVNESPAEKFDVDFNFIGDGYIAIDDGQMVVYSDVFPFSDDLFFEIDGEKCIALPMFCLARGCKCSNAVLQTFRLESPDPYLSILIDYKKKKFSAFENIRWNSSAIDFDKLRNILLTSFPDLFRRLKIKHAKLAKVYKISRKKYIGSSDNWEKTIGYASDDIPEEIHQRTEKKIARNDPCPCGSGKKYKKCCLK